MFEEINLYSIKDSLAEEFAPLFEAKSDELAKRVTSALFKKFPDMVLTDFNLYKLGHYSPKTGVITAYENPLKIDME